ncbi:hypothetical protein [Salinirussus salinus]|uniref:hypothetical protein n=1 Tax=Salinirussus salinus TaxID=1198300 RepID=UPI00135A9A14|nr:hypothetical protein [Salinirussus salinus]
MSDLPDLDTSQVGVIAYWNAIDDGGVGSIDAEEALTDGNITSYTLYDNGFTADYGQTAGNNFNDPGSNNNFRNLRVRVKNDGWIVAYIDPSVTLGNNGATGWFDFIGGTQWEVRDAAYNHNFTLTPTMLEETVERLASNLSNYGSMTFNYSDVGLYTYVHPDTETLFLGSHRQQNQDGGTHYTGGISYTADTNLDFAYCIGGVDSGGDLTFEGTLVSDNGTTGAIDLLSEGLIPNSGTEYVMDAHIFDGADGYGLTFIGYH